MHERSTDPDVVERVRSELAWVTKYNRRHVEIPPEDVRELIDRYDRLTAALTSEEKVEPPVTMTADGVMSDNAPDSAPYISREKP
jgi:hypothetical protein